MDLRQRKLFTVREFAMQEDRLRVKIKNLINSFEVDIPFEEINFKKIIREKKTDIVSVVLGVFFAFMFLISLVLVLIDSTDLDWAGLFILLGFTALSWLYAYLGSKKQVLIPTLNNRIVAML